MNVMSRLPQGARIILVLCFGGLLAAPAAWAQQDAVITPNFRDADIREIVEAVGEVTGRSFILDPRVNAKVTVLSSTPMSAEAFYETFLSILQVHGYVAIDTGDLVKIIPDATARQFPSQIGHTLQLPEPIGDVELLVFKYFRGRPRATWPTGGS